jgi:hypothetical protein
VIPRAKPVDNAMPAPLRAAFIGPRRSGGSSWKVQLIWLGGGCPAMTSVIPFDDLYLKEGG